MKVEISYNKKAKDTVKVSVESRDLWNADVTLARVIYPVIRWKRMPGKPFLQMLFYSMRRWR